MRALMTGERATPRATRIALVSLSGIEIALALRMFETLDGAELCAVCGGIQMKVTQYGYPNDPYTDSETRAGHGAYRNLDNDSMAITDSGLKALGLSRQDV